MRNLKYILPLLLLMNGGCEIDPLPTDKVPSSAYSLPTFFGSLDFIKLPSTLNDPQMDFIPKSIEAFKHVIRRYRDSLFYAGDHYVQTEPLPNFYVNDILIAYGWDTSKHSNKVRFYELFGNNSLTIHDLDSFTLFNLEVPDKRWSQWGVQNKEKTSGELSYTSPSRVGGDAEYSWGFEGDTFKLRKRKSWLGDYGFYFELDTTDLSGSHLDFDYAVKVKWDSEGNLTF
jgi:hypothetical protein